MWCARVKWMDTEGPNNVIPGMASTFPDHETLVVFFHQVIFPNDLSISMDLLLNTSKVGTGNILFLFQLLLNFLPRTPSVQFFVVATQSDVGCCWPVMKNLLRPSFPISSHKEQEEEEEKTIPVLVASDREQDGRSYPRHCVRSSPDDRWKLLAGPQTVSMLVQDPILKLYIINSFNRQ